MKSMSDTLASFAWRVFGKLLEDGREQLSADHRNRLGDRQNTRKKSHGNLLLSPNFLEGLARRELFTELSGEVKRDFGLHVELSRRHASDATLDDRA
jgi:hypothetical protein